MSPPMFIFPRVRFKDHIDHIDKLCLWMTTDNFQLFLQHLVKHTQSTKHNPLLLLCGNHESHISLERLDYAPENGSVMLCSTHCSHNLQLLERTVYGSFKEFYNNSCESKMYIYIYIYNRFIVCFPILLDFLYNNPSKAMTVYEIPEIAGCAYPKSVKSENKQSGFQISGIHLFNENVFIDDEFLPSKITNRVQEQPSEMEVNDGEQHGTSGVTTSTSGVPKPPEHIRPFKKAPPRKCKINRRVDSTRILRHTKNDLHNGPNNCHAGNSIGCTY